MLIAGRDQFTELSCHATDESRARRQQASASCFFSRSRNGMAH